MGVVLIDARCARRDSRWAWFPIDARCGWGDPKMMSSAYAGGVRAMATGSPNTPMQLTPLRVRKILAFLKASIDPNVIPIYRWRRN